MRKLKGLIIFLVLIAVSSTFSCTSSPTVENETIPTTTPEGIYDPLNPPPLGLDESRVLDIFSDKYGVPAESLELLEISDEWIGGTDRNNPVSGKRVQVYSSLDITAENGTIYKLVIDADYVAFTRDEFRQAWRDFEETYSKYCDNRLVATMARILLEDTLPVEIWLHTDANRGAIIRLIQSAGFQPISPSRVVPTVFAEIPKELILELTERSEVDFIYYWEQRFELDETKQETAIHGEDLTFEILIKSDSGGPDENSRLFVFKDSRDVLVSSGWIQTDHIEELKKIDFTKYVALLAFHGYGRSEILTKRVCREGDVVYTVLRNRYTILQQIDNSPYVIIKLDRKQFEGQGNFDFELLDQNGRTMASTSAHFD